LHVDRYVPDSSRQRALAFFLLFLYHAANALGRTYAMALLAQVNWLWLMGYMVVDHVKFQLLKLALRDFSYWMPAAGGLVSSLVRFGAKVVADFTGAPTFRPCT
jgi:hypothetical protein